MSKGKPSRPPGTYPYARRFKTNKGLVRAFCSIIPPTSSVVDIGAGTGPYVHALKSRGWNITGIDGTPKIEELSNGLTQWADLTGDCERFHRSADWGLFIEVGEHIPKRFEQQLMDQVSRIPKSFLIITWATHGQPGRRHINCRTQVYIASQFTNRGWMVDDELTEGARGFVNDKYKERLMVLYKDD